MDSNYYSVLICVRKGREDVYIDGAPLAEFVEGQHPLLTTKRKDFKIILEQLNKAYISLADTGRVINVSSFQKVCKTA